MGHSPRIAGADPGLRAVDGSDPSLRGAWYGTATVGDVHGHPNLALGRSRTNNPLREGHKAASRACRRPLRPTPIGHWLRVGPDRRDVAPRVGLQVVIMMKAAGFGHTSREEKSMTKADLAGQVADAIAREPVASRGRGTLHHRGG